MGFLNRQGLWLTLSLTAAVVAGGAFAQTPSGSILRAVVYGDGHGRPDSLLIYYAEGGATLGDGGAPKPDKVTLAWPTLAAGVVMTTNADAINVRGDYLLQVDLAGATLSGATARPRGYTTVERKIVTVYSGDAVDDGFDVIDGIGPVITVDNDEAAGGNPILTENVNAGVYEDVITMKISEQLRSTESLKGKTLFYTKDANPANEPGASGGDELEVVDAFLSGPNTYQVMVKAVAGGLRPGYWIRFNPNGGVVDRAKVDGVIEDNKPHPGNRWAQLKLQEVAPSVREAWYTSSSFTGVPDYAYVRFDKNVVLADWFSDGSVNFGKNDVVNVAAVGLSSLFAASGDTLRINLAVAFKSSQTAIRTSEDMPFTLGYASGKKDEWEGVTRVDVLATDRAKPVLVEADLKSGVKTGTRTTPDTLRVTYSERPSNEALALERPVIIVKKDGGSCEPVLKLSGQVVPVMSNSSRFYKATYLIEGDLAMQCPAYPEIGDIIRINAAAGFRDDRQPPNIQDVVDNLRQSLNKPSSIHGADREIPKASGNGAVAAVAPVAPLTHTFTIGPNPAGKSSGAVSFFWNGGNAVKSGNLSVYDASGSFVKKIPISNKPSGRNVGGWDLTDAKGRPVSEGTYLVRGVVKTSNGKSERVSLVVGVR